ncbi:HMG box-containing protein 1 isoform X1 [Octopus bimaculoides]|nr:HMG box-containing protein 1 isoform X1 [Octopus bimaculoides]
MASVGDATLSKRSRVKTERMQEFEKSQEDNVTQKLLKCPKDGCGKVFTSVPGLRYHTKTHVDPHRRFICEKCDKSFKSANGLKYHRGKTKGCYGTGGGFQNYKTDKSASDADTDDSANEDYLSQDTSADESMAQPLQQTEYCREITCDSADTKTIKTEGNCGKCKPMPLTLSSAVSPLVSSPTTTTWPSVDDNNPTTDVNKLQQLAIIATGPESPLLKTETTSIKHQQPSSADGSDPQVSSSAPCPASPEDSSKGNSTWSHPWPTTVWQCFMKGVQIQFPETNWQTAEELARLELLSKSASSCGKEDNKDSYAAKGLRLVCMTKIYDGKDSENNAWHLNLKMSPDIDSQSSLLAKCAPDHPFFVLEKGWSSYNPAVTVEHYGIPCRKLEEDDICLPPLHHDATYTHEVFETLQQSFDFTPSDSSAVLALSYMAKQRRDLEENQAKKQPVVKTDSLKAKRPMNGFMLFAKKNRLEYTQMYPGRDNR